MMKAAVLHAPRDLRLESVPIPRPDPGEVIVRVQAALMCGTDLKTWKRGHRILPLPAILGHEAAGIVEWVGEGVVDFRPGDRVVPAISGPCGECDLCRCGRENLCRTAMDPGEKTWGAFAQFLRVPARVVASNLFRIPDDVAFEEAALLDPLASCVQAWSRLPVPRGATVAILGAGALGLINLLVARELGASRVVVSGRRPARLELARLLGADAVIDAPRERSPREAASAILAATGTTGFDIVVACAGTAETWEEATWLAHPGATVSLFSGCGPGTRVPFDADRLHYEEVSLIGSFHYGRAAAREAFRLICSRALPIARILGERVPLEKVPELFELHDRQSGLKEIIVP